MTQRLKAYWEDLRHYTPIPKRYKKTQGKNAEYWHDVIRRYGDFKKEVDSIDYHWYVITFKDGRKELAYFKVYYAVKPHCGRLCRGRIIHRYWSPFKFEHTSKIKLAF